jgi:hypothetical protein
MTTGETNPLGDSQRRVEVGTLVVEGTGTEIDPPSSSPSASPA